jgi:hypothetical protein
MRNIALGDIYLIPTPPNGSHYYVAIAKIDDEIFLFVNYSTLQDYTSDEDAAYTLSPSRTHLRCLTQESYFVFGSAKEYGSNELNLLKATYQATFPNTIVDSIQYAGISNNSLKNKYKRLLKACLGL